MTSKAPYTYTVLRYVHDTATAEFVNVGIVLHCAKHRYLGVRLRHTYGRLSALFPDLDSAAFKNAMSLLEGALRASGVNYNKTNNLNKNNDAAAFAKSVLPIDDSSLQWSPVGSGLTASPHDQLENLYARLVSSYDERQEIRRSDADVWRPVRERLDAADISSKLKHKIIRSDVDVLEFKHAWKNGVWHCLEALSFDLASPDSIKTKARTWLGHLTAVRDASEKFQPYFVVGAPSDRQLMPAYEQALAILKDSPVEPEIFPESEADRLVAHIVAEITTHAKKPTRN
jgi:hypothetical protein